MEPQIRPTVSEQEFLSLTFNKFYDIFEEIFEDSFWKNQKCYRFNKIKQAFAIYSELLNYEPIKLYLKNLKTSRPPMEAEIGGELFKVIRNLIAHFPYFDYWDEVWVKQSLINWEREGMTIDRFFKKYEGKEEVKYRFWEEEKKEMTYLSIKFPEKYSDNSKVILKEIITEKEGVKFSLILMKQILNSQVEEIKDTAPNRVDGPTSDN